ncbi:competence/damage-inducible protein A [Clostridium hydrogeniformans]|uniref:competence/damage-inducible protein A n=1 Tax=Clostridium hydrogeniformans TaxID=349933 RepID=UPI00048983B0|nr:competence/damage-inducible protein A [Clostridium hydrogeniformans]
MRAEIISVGTELLLGDIVNTNAQFLAKELADLGIDMYHQTVVGDNEERLLRAFDEAFKTCDIIITTGGLGPTEDDLTKEMAAKYFNKELICHEESYRHLEEYFKKSGMRLSENNKKQAYFPKDAIILKNICGTAPGAIIKGENNKAIVVLPGPPREMTTMFKNEVKPYLESLTDSVLVSKVLRICGIGESHMEEKVKHIIHKYENPTIAPYAKDGEAILRLTAKAKNEKEAKNIIEPAENDIREILKDNIYGEGDTSLDHVVAKLLVDKNLKIGVAESCTGGLLASMLISYPGISKVFLEGAVTYSNDAKMRTLGVKKETLDRFGAVSEETAKEMAEGIAKRCEGDIGVSITGIAGPDGGTVEKPVGLVYVGLYIKGEIKVKKLTLQGDRDRIRRRTTMSALDFIRREVK